MVENGSEGSIQSRQLPDLGSFFVTIFAIADLDSRHSNKSNGLRFPRQLARAKSRVIHWKSG
jgi:hypothetical protein